MYLRAKSLIIDTNIALIVSTTFFDIFIAILTCSTLKSPQDGTLHLYLKQSNMMKKYHILIGKLHIY